MNWWSLTLLALAVSLDGLWSGLAFGLRGVRISNLALLVIAAVAGSAALATLAAGTILAGAFSAGVARLLGGAIMMALGLAAVYRGYQEQTGGVQNSEASSAGGPGPGQGLAGQAAPPRGRWAELRLFLRRLLLILRNPAAADADFSGVISIPEALVLALAVSLDGALAGFGAGLSGFNALATPALIGFFQAGLQWLGNLVAASMPATLRHSGRFHYLPGTILIVVGLLRIF